MERFREATGKDVGALEAEKAARGALESRTKAQVGGPRGRDGRFQGVGAGGRGPSACC